MDGLTGRRGQNATLDAHQPVATYMVDLAASRKWSERPHAMLHRDPGIEHAWLDACTHDWRVSGRDTVDRH